MNPVNSSSHHFFHAISTALLYQNDFYLSVFSILKELSLPITPLDTFKIMIISPFYLGLGLPHIKQYENVHLALKTVG